MKLFLYGESGVGKSTCVRRVMEECGLDVAGFLTFWSPFDPVGLRTLSMMDVRSMLTHPDMYCAAVGDGRGDHRVYTDVFNSVGVRMLTFDHQPQLVIMDELGFMENEALEFQRRVLDIIESDVDVLGVIKPRREGFVARVHDHEAVHTLEVKYSNREELASWILRMLKKSHVSACGHSHE